MNPEAEEIAPPQDGADPVPPEVIHKALQHMRRAARGNGINPATLTLDGLEDGEILSFGAKSLFEIKPTLARKTVPGRDKGEVCSSAADLHARVAAATERTTFDTGIIDYATNFLSRRADKGFMVNNLGLKLERLNRKFLFYNTCTNCGDGKINCMACQGAGQVNCTQCRGARTIRCPQCFGMREIKTQNGGATPCIRCNAQGTIACEFCGADGRIPCQPCQSTGQVACSRCKGTGIMSDVAHVSFEARTHFYYDGEALPPEVPPQIDALGPKMGLQHHAVIEFLRQKEQRGAQKEHEMAEHGPVRDELVVPFWVWLPWGHLRFRCGDKILRLEGQDRLLPGALFGYQAKLLEYPPFLEKPVAPGLDRLTQAAHGLGHVRGNLDEALKFRVIADAVLAACSLPPKKAVALMEEHWPVGLSGDVLEKMVLLAARAYHNISRLPRYAGLGVGLALGAGFDVAYLLGPLRTGLYAGLSVRLGAFASYALMGVDLAVVAGVGVLADILSRAGARLALRSLLESLRAGSALGKTRKRGRVVSGSARPFAYAGGAIVFTAVLLYAAYTGAALPDWAGFVAAFFTRR